MLVVEMIIMMNGDISMDDDGDGIEMGERR